MPSRSWQLCIQDMLDTIAEIQQCTLGITFADFEVNRILAKAILYDFLVIGEASKNIPTEIQLRYPQVPWRSMSDMRNVMVHEYFRVDLEIVWDGIQNDLSVHPYQVKLVSSVVRARLGE